LEVHIYRFNLLNYFMETPMTANFNLDWERLEFVLEITYRVILNSLRETLMMKSMSLSFNSWLSLEIT
jgi:uncharacterized protein YjaG (DUF416 family)